jgi:hypothetical protein
MSCPTAPAEHHAVSRDPYPALAVALWYTSEMIERTWDSKPVVPVGGGAQGPADSTGAATAGLGVVTPAAAPSSSAGLARKPSKTAMKATWTHRYAAWCAVKHQRST